MQGLENVLKAVDSWMGVTALVLILSYLLLWKYGGELLKLTRQNAENSEAAREDAAEAKATVEKISQDIVTNHGSKNLGDAIDRLTGWMLDHIKEAEKDSEKIEVLEVRTAMDSLRVERALAVVETLAGRVDAYITSNAELMEFGWSRLAEAKEVEEALALAEPDPTLITDKERSCLS